MEKKAFLVTTDACSDPNEKKLQSLIEVTDLENLTKMYLTDVN
jgi:hypothetical protein